MENRDEETDRFESSKHEEKLERFAEKLIEAMEFNAWEYGNTGDFPYN